MDFAFTPEQIESKRVAARFLATHASSSRLRAAMGGATGFDAEAWDVAKELGWAALLVPTEHGGAGLGWIEVLAIAEETGSVLGCLPFFSTVCLGVNALLAAGDEAVMAEHLPPIAAGDTLATLAFAEEACADPFAITTSARPCADGYELTGTKRYVVDGHLAHLLLVTARDPGTAGEDGVALYAIPSGSAGVRAAKSPTMDLTRSQATVELRAVRVGKGARVGDSRVLRRALDRAGVALAAEALGGAERCLEAATEYAKTRVQFGRPIGSFQAIKHKLADLLVAVETARSAVHYAAWAADTGDDGELATAAPLAKSYATEAFFRCAAESIQIHGGVGFTWEHEAHLFLKRARGSLSLLGSPAADRERIARALGLCGATPRGPTALDASPERVEG